MKASGVRKSDGKPWTRQPAIFDGQGNYIPSDRRPQIGGGTEGKVSFELSGFYTTLVGAGVSLRLQGVQILSLVEFGGGSAESHGFEAEADAYVANTVQTLDDLEKKGSGGDEDEDEVPPESMKDF